MKIEIDPEKMVYCAPVKRAPRHRCILPNHWVHVSARTQQGRFAFVPVDEHFTAHYWGIVSRGMMRYAVKVAAFVLPSGHFHVLCKARRPAAISHFIQYIKGIRCTDPVSRGGFATGYPGRHARQHHQLSSAATAPARAAGRAR